MRLAVLLLAILLAAGPALADTFRPITIVPGYKRTSWTSENGAPTEVNAIAQSKDGYLWLGTPNGLYRFDGVEFERLPQFERKNSSGVSKILVTRSGDMWLGYAANGVALIRQGRLVDTGPSSPKTPLIGMTEAPNGDVWVVTTQQLSRYRSGRWATFKRTDNPRQILFGRDGAIWILRQAVLMVRRPGAGSFEQVRGRVELGADLIEDPQGRILLGMDRTIRVVEASGPGSFTLAPFLENLPEPLSGGAMRFGRDGALWLVGGSRSILRLPGWPSARGPGVKPVVRGAAYFEAPASAPAYSMQPMFEDREGSIWVGSGLGLDRFRPVDLVAETAITEQFADFQPNGLSQYEVLADGRNVIYVRLGDRLYRMAGSGRAVRLPVVARGHEWDHVCTSRGGGVWIRQGNAMVLIDAPRPRRVALPTSPSGEKTYVKCIEDGSGRLWVNAAPMGLFRREGSGWRHFLIDHERPNAGGFYLGRDQLGRVLAYNGYGHLTRMEEERSVYLWRKESNSLAFVEAILPNPKYLLIGGEAGLARYDGRRFATLSSSDFPFLQDVSGIVQTPAGETWLMSKAGIVQLATRELETRFEDPRRPLRHRLFDLEEGLFGVSETFGFENARRGADGRIWFATNNGIFSIDPARIRKNSLPPPVALKRLVANGTSYAPGPSLTLAKGIRNLRIDFTALSLRNAARVRFRYRLDGVDDGWVDPGQRRQAIYTNLGPGDYRFQVIAANDEGVWNRTGASLDFTIPPTFVQSRLFLVLCVLAGALLLWALYAFRLRRLAARMKARHEERLGERERIARELHDTLLQSVQGLILRFQSVADGIPPQLDAHRELVKALDRADEIVAEGRDSVLGLRSSQLSGALSQVLADGADRLLTRSRLEIAVATEGTARELRPHVAHEIVRIGDEALFNIDRHAAAKTVKIDIAYGRRSLTVRIADDGVGIPAEIVVKGGRDGHFGLVGMRERAARIEADLTVGSPPGGGTEILLTVPARVVYADYLESRWGSIFRARATVPAE